MNCSARRLIWTFAVVCALGVAQLLAPSISSASTNTVSSTSSVGMGTCSLSALSQPFAPWLDYAQYELTPGGDFETAAWTLTSGAKLVPGSEPYAVTGTLGSYALSLPLGSSAQSPLTCVDAMYPSIRFFVAGTGSVAVDVIYGNTVVPAGVVTAGGPWTPTPVMLTSSALFGTASGGTAQVSVAFTGLSGSPLIDDVFVDPWSRG
jgi:hypothetical protein